MYIRRIVINSQATNGASFYREKQNNDNIVQEYKRHFSRKFTLNKTYLCKRDFRKIFRNLYLYNAPANFASGVK